MAKKKEVGKASPDNPYGLPDGGRTSSFSSSGKVSAGSGTYDQSKNQGAKFDGKYDDVADRPLDDYYYDRESYYNSKYEEAKENGDWEGMLAANQGMNQVRNDYGLAAQFADKDIASIKGKYTGSISGGGSIGGGGFEFPEFSYGSAPEFVSQWEGIINDLANQILNRPDFSYDYTKDPLYSQYKEVYTREGDRAMQDTLGAVSARTGGLASSYATSAANQSNNYYMSMLSDKVPELQQLAYSMYQDEGNRLMSMLDMVMSLEQGDYSKFQDQLNQWNTDRNFNYGLTQDKIANDRYEKEWAYQLQQDQYNNDLDMAGLLASVGDYSGYANLWGLSEAQTQALIDQYAKNQSLTDRESAMALADWMAQYGDFSGLKNLGVDTSYLDANQRAELAGLSSGGSRGSSSGSGSGNGGETMGIIDTMLSYGDDVKAYEYLLGQGLTVSATEQLWQMYLDQEEEGTGGNMETDGYNDAYFRAAMNSLSTRLQQDPELALQGIESMWDKLSDDQKQQVQTLLARFGYQYEE